MQIKRTGVIYYYNDINILSCMRAYFSNELFGCNTAHLIYKYCVCNNILLLLLFLLLS